ncbi:MAG: STAS domain-containing protein, partial [Fibrobacterota bacterium]
MRFETRTIGVFEVLSVQLVADEVFDAGRLRQETLRLVERGSRRIVVDLGGVDYLYSDSINALVALNRRMLESSGRMGILVPHPKVYDILVRAGLENIMRLYRSEAELQSDSRELMRQSSAWTRPAELLSAASASQVLSANVLSPKNPNELRDAASASQRIPRRRVGSRVELKPRRRGGRGMDQEQPTAEFQLPPALPALPGESTTMRTLSQDSSAFDQQSTFGKTSKVPRQPIQPRPEPPPSVEPSVYNVPENTQHDGYSTDAWLLSLTSPTTAKPTSPEQIVEATAAAGSSSFLPKVSPNDASKLQDTPSKFATEFAWDESEISLTGSSPGPSGAPPPSSAPTRPPAAPPVSPWLSQLGWPPQRPAALA